MEETPKADPVTVRDFIVGIVGLIVVIVVAAHIFVFGSHYIPWLDYKVARAFGEPTRTPTPIVLQEWVVASPTPTSTATPTPVRPYHER